MVRATLAWLSTLELTATFCVMVFCVKSPSCDSISSLKLCRDGLCAQNLRGHAPGQPSSHHFQQTLQIPAHTIICRCPSKAGSALVLPAACQQLLKLEMSKGTASSKTTSAADSPLHRIMDKLIGIAGKVK